RLLLLSSTIVTLFPYTTLFRSLKVYVTYVYPFSILLHHFYFFKNWEIIGLNSRSEEHTSELQSRFDLVCRLLLEKKKTSKRRTTRTSFLGCDWQRRTALKK